MVMITNNGNQTFTVTQSGKEVFTGPIAEAMQVHARLSLAARPAAVTSARKAARLAEIAERKQAGL